MVKLTDISKWPSQISDVVTIGKRIKKVVYHPTSFRENYFKEPKEEFPWEFWTEVIASRIGLEFGFNIIQYDIGISNESVGCLSKSMVKSNEMLVHGQQYLTALKLDFEIEKGIDHTFQLVEQFFKSRGIYNGMIDEFIEMLIFDAIIGNRDRHQQNWAIIQPNSFVSTGKILYSEFLKNQTMPRFSPIFDNGNSLAYEILEDKIPKLLDNSVTCEKYLFGKKATSHVRWNGKIVTHIELITEIHNIYPDTVKKVVQRVREKKGKINIEAIIQNIDDGIIFADAKFSLTDNRKKLITLLLEKRIKKLLDNF
ncbi:HipA domain-containing protein [Flavobacterium solisilvae]|uniref:HipA-like C-terminal domain-containing protein n=1 Tax=Flavobacterium solisilvae TaxID=1852019 RepID=A0ABX1QYH1_9FLAO|nr:hypothetical protein [Flavobacterium solisilvae]NMH26213.1 hypothetical protein [Flavobacterium solisilvae]